MMSDHDRQTVPTDPIGGYTRSRAYRITAVPTLVVAGKYRIETNMAGRPERMLEVVDFLVAKERAAAGEG